MTTTNPALLADGTDDVFRKLLYDLFTIGERMTEARRFFGRQIGLSGPEFTLLTAIHEIQGETGASPSTVAGRLHVSAPFVAAESRKLVRLGLIEKRTDPRDARVSRLRLTPDGTEALDRVLPVMRRINDLIFAVDTEAELRVVSRVVERFVLGSAEAMGVIAADRHAQRLREPGVPS